MSAFVLGGANSWKEGRQHSAFLRFLYIDMSLWHVVGTGSAEAEATSLAEPPTATSDSELLPLSILAARIRFFFAFSWRAEALQLPRDAERHGTCAAASRSWEAVGGFCAARERERELAAAAAAACTYSTLYACKGSNCGRLDGAGLVGLGEKETACLQSPGRTQKTFARR